MTPSNGTSSESDTPADEFADDLADKGVSGTDGPISRHINRPLSGLISRRMAPLPITPDQWTYASFGSVCAGAAAFAVGLPRMGALLVHAGSLLDGVDGEVARLQGTSSPQGALLDLTLDRVSDVAVLAGLALGAGGRRFDWLLALTAANGIVISSVVKERVGAEGHNVAQLQRDEGTEGLGGWLLPFTNSDGRRLAVTLCGLMRQPRLALIWLAGTSSLRLLRRLSVARATLRGGRRD